MVKCFRGKEFCFNSGEICLFGKLIWRSIFIENVCMLKFYKIFYRFMYNEYENIYIIKFGKVLYLKL